MKKLKERWGVTSNKQVIVILIVFSLTGTLSARIAKPFTHFIGLDFEAFHPVLAWVIRLIIVLPIYQILLLIIGTLFGQFQFFWQFEKKMLSRLGIKFKKENNLDKN